jgi:AraC-like DNA-binding protein
MLPVASQSSSPILHVLQEQIVPAVEAAGMGNIVVAHSSLELMQAAENRLPEGVLLTPKPLKSKRTPIRGRRNYSNARATLDARWPQDGLHSNRMPILMFVVAGRVAIPLGDYVLRCKPGQGILILPGTPHPDGSHLCVDDGFEQDDACTMLSFKILGDGITCWVNHTREGKHWSHGTVGEFCYVLNAKARLTLEMLTEEAGKRGPYFRMICDGLVRVLVGLLLREIQELRAYQQPVRSNQAMARAEVSAQQDPIARAQEYVRSHLKENLSIDTVAAHVYMSRAYFTRRFRASTGKTFNAYVTECRLEAAKTLLQDTEWPIEKIGLFVGLTAPRLRVLFQQQLGQAPSSYRLGLRDGENASK